MGLKKSGETTEHERGKNLEKRARARDFSGLLEELRSEDPTKRRWAARDLGQWPEAAEALLEAVISEPEHPVREALFDSLGMIGGEVVVRGLLNLLHSDDASLRNGAIELLQTMPDSVAEHIAELLTDADSDIRIFAIDILQELAHPHTPAWLLDVLERDAHVNVIATAVDRLAEVGEPEMVPALEAVRQRFPDEPYLHFALDTAIRRIRGE